MNVNEYGVMFLFSTGFDMSAHTALQINFTKPDGSLLTKTNPNVTLGTVPITTTAGLFAAHFYVQYTFVNGDVNQVGDWSARVIYDDATPLHLISDVAQFTINP